MCYDEARKRKVIFMGNGEVMNNRHLGIIDRFGKRAFAGILAVTTILTGCGKNASDEAKVDSAADALSEQELLPINVLDDSYRTTYEILVYSFYDSDGDGIGDLNGVSQKLDYINDGDDATDSDLGCNEIWLMPICPSTTYHKYDVTDYKDIDPEYGTLEDFDNLIAQCHDRGINVIIDTVFNHSSSSHPWFIEATDYLREHPGLEFDGEEARESDNLANAKSDCPYLDYYNFSNTKQAGFEPVKDTDYFYEARFWSEMPDLNLDSLALRQELSDIMHFWTGRGVDGFRLDATTYYYTGDDQKNIEFLKWLKEDNPDAYFVGEAWANAATYQKYYVSGIDSFFDFEYAGSEGIIASIVRGNSPASRFAEALEVTEKTLAGKSGSAIDAPFYTNHDMARSAGYYTGSGGQDKIKLAYGLSLIMSGNSFIYYGEELGMKGSGKDENKRAPMYWSESDQTGMCKGPKDMDNFKMKYPALDEQDKDPYSIYNYFKAAIRLRNVYPVVARGTTTAVKELSTREICAFTRSVTEEQEGKFLSGEDISFGPQQLLFIINTSADEQTVDLGSCDSTKEYKILSYQLNTSEATNSLFSNTLTMAPYGIAVLTR